MSTIIKGLKWGFDGGYISCGKAEGNRIVELEVLKNNKTQYCLVSIYEIFAGYLFSDISYFDSILEQNFLNVPKYDFDLNIEKYEIVLDKHQDVYKEVLFLMKVLSEYHSIMAPSMANSYIEPYIDKDLETIELLSMDEYINKIK